MPADTPPATAAVDAAATAAAASGDPAEASPSGTTTKKRQHWTPLEANPDVFTSFARRLGLPAASAHFVDVYGLDEDLLSFVPRPVYALLLLFPITPATEAVRAAEEAALKAAHHTPPPSIFHMRQTVGNACGVVGAVHALAAAAPHLPRAEEGRDSPFVEGSYLDTFLPAARPLATPAARGALLEDPPEGAPTIAGEAAAAGAGGQTAAPPPEAAVDLHYAALVPAEVDGAWRLVELDGRKAFPIDHGPLSDGPLGSLLGDAAAVARAAVALGGESIQFNMMALVGGGGGGQPTPPGVG